MMPKKSSAVHPVLLAVYPVLFLYSHNIGEVRFGDVVGPVLVILAVTIAAWGLLRVLTRSWRKSAMITSFFLLLFFSYGHIRALVGARISIFLSLVLLFLFLGGSFYIIRTRKPLEKATMILNVFAAVLVAFTLANIAIYELAAAGRATQEDTDFDVRVSSGQAPQSDAYPDIYFIIPDAYASQDVLREIYNFDNSDFIKFLRARGFYVADKCAANYCQTGLSVGSCLNLAYLDNLAKIVGPYYIGRRPLGVIIEKSYVHKFLKERGYRTVSFATNVYLTDLRDADFYLKSGTMVNVFHNSIINATPLPDIIKLKKEPSDFDAHRHNILYIFNNIGKVSQMHPGPKFVFVHIEVPHAPFVFGPNGEPVNVDSRLSYDDADWLIRPDRLSRAQYRKAYCDQIRFVNSRMKKVIDEILSNSSRPPIILILGDHGPRSEVIWEDPSRTNMKECLSILGAFYLPGGGEELLYPDMTLVNLFRVIFNHYFGGKLELLPDRCYFSTARYLYRFYDVTDRVREVYKGHPADQIEQ